MTDRRPASPGPRPASRAPRALRALWWRARFVVAALCCGLAASAVVDAVRPAPPPTVPVVVTAHDVRGGVALTTHDVRAVEIAPDLVPAGALADVDDAVGRTTSVRLASGTALQESLVAAGDLVAAAPEGTVVVPVRLDPEVAALLVPGDRVDLVVAEDVTGMPDPFLARGALVVPGRGAAGSGGVLDVVGPAEAGGITLVAADPDEAARIAGATGWAEVRAVLVP
ncbi:flagellar biosynthesis protein FlgA [Cellulosimicrobium terreum]|nr:flagellar biosynthesis protein FlgA [Cellulosimicrobium terreum]